MLFHTFVSLILSVSLASVAHAKPPHSPPRRTIAGVSVIDTPIVRAAQDFARAHSDVDQYNHVVRSCLFGALILTHNDTLRSSVDEEVQAVALVLHDLGMGDFDSPFVTRDRRFEVDGAFAARDFIRSHPDGKRWNERRVQLVWDAIALHAEPKIALYKEPDVVAVYWGNDLDFSGPSFGVTEAEYNAVLAEFPKGMNQTLDGILFHARFKPETTYDTFLQPFGEMFVPGYSALGHRAIDRLLGRQQPSR
ncbi:hypothetical protein QBC34DRAFT_313315 [Podospora aff. communis PSN243]|uniref:HD domain-containing protein n=1 Tax=Podospora aff. communis PSN243 TaxID=3040156 RepID=A0AAV9G1Y1_9PEZI|nr:hypothetical protein QBC34DRAFT_313315 [Podospora aff. communis PSN243]